MTAAFSFFLAALFAFTGSGARADSPDRYLDGDKLAAHITPWLAKNTTAQNRADFVDRADMTAKLGIGNEFFPFEDPGRVALREWIREQPDDSITPHALFEKAVVLRGGNIQGALILAWDELREGWRRPPRRNVYPRTLKLIDITGEREAFRGNIVLNNRPDADDNGANSETVRGDNFSAWYHFFGTALHAYTVSRKHGSFLGLKNTQGIILLQEYFFTPQYVDPLKRLENDRAGARFGAALAAWVHNPVTPTEPTRSTADISDYLYDKPDLFGKTWQLAPDQAPEDFRLDRKTKSGLSLLETIRHLRSLEGKKDAASHAEVLALVRTPLKRTPLEEESDENAPYDGGFGESPAAIRHSAAIQTLGTFDDATSLAELHRLVASSEWADAEAAIGALARRKDPHLLSHIRELQKSKVPVVRAAAVRALEQQTLSAEMIPILTKSLQDEDIFVLDTAVNTYHFMSGEKPAALVTLAKQAQSKAFEARTKEGEDKANDGQKYVTDKLYLGGKVVLGVGTTAGVAALVRHLLIIDEARHERQSQVCATLLGNLDALPAIRWPKRGPLLFSLKNPEGDRLEIHGSRMNQTNGYVISVLPAGKPDQKAYYYVDNLFHRKQGKILYARTLPTSIDDPAWRPLSRKDSIRIFSSILDALKSVK